MAVPFKTRYDHYHYSFLDESLSFVIFWEQPEGAWRRSRNLFEYIVIFEIILKTIYCGATISFQFCWCCGERVASAWFVIAVAALGRLIRCHFLAARYRTSCRKMFPRLSFSDVFCISHRAGTVRAHSLHLLEKPFDSVQYPFQFCWCCCERVASAWFVIAVAALGRLIRCHFGSP